MEADKELEQQLMDAGNKLLELPDSIDELLPLIDQVESYLLRVEQSPTDSMQNALSPLLKALVAEQLFKHSEVDVKVAVASCISEITRITAPDAPYEDDKMKEIFQLIVSSFENLSDKSSRSYTKRTSILETVSKVRSCVIMLDLECDALIIEMFQHFLEAIRDDHSESVFSSMETIMNLVLEESEEISPELLSPILDCVKKDNEKVLPVARKLGEKVLQSCAAKVKPYLLEAVKSSGISLDDYSEVVASICREASVAVEPNDVHVSNEHMTGEEESKSVKAPLDKAAPVNEEIVTEAASMEQVDSADNRSPKSIVNNGTAQTGENDNLAVPNSLKKEEPGNPIDQSKGVETASNAEPVSSVADKAASAEGKPEQTTKRKGKKPNFSMKSEEPSDGSQIDGEKETKAVLDHKNDNKEVPSSPHEEPTAEGAVSSENGKQTGIQVSSPKVTEGESMDVDSPSPSRSVPNESRAESHGCSKKKDVLLKEGTPSADDVSKNASEGTSDSEAKPLILLGKKVPVGSSNENKTSVADVSKKESDASSESEAKFLKQSANKLGASSNNEDESTLKQLHDKKRREKATPGKDAPRSSTKDDKEIISSSKSSAKPAKGEQHFGATSKSNSKRKRTPVKEKASDTEDLGENLVGSKVKVWWPEDHMFYDGVIESFDPLEKKHKVSYNDGDEEILNLRKERWEFIGGDSDSEKEQADDCESPNASSEMLLKKKLKTSAEQSAKQGKSGNSPKKGGGPSSSKSKVADAKSSRKSKHEINAHSKSKDGPKTISENDNVGKNKDHTSKSGSKSADAASKSSSKSKNDALDTSKSGKSKEGGSGAPKTSSKSKQETPKTSSKSKQETPKISSNVKDTSKTVGKSNANGTGKSKSSSTKVKEVEDIKDTTDSAKVVENTKENLSIPSKTPGSEGKSGKKRGRGSKS